MPYWSISEWRARIGSSWCVLGRPHKIKSFIRHGARVINKELTLNRGVTMIILLIMLIGINTGVRGVIATRHHRQLLSWFEDLYGLLHQKVFMLTLALILTSVLKILTDLSLKCSQWHSVICGESYNSPINASFLLYIMFLVVKMMYPAINLIPWLVPAVIHAQDMERIIALLRVLINKQVEVFDLKLDQNESLLAKRRKDLRILYLVNTILGITLSVTASIIASLLLLSGDIEENPGPDLDYGSVDATQILCEDDLIDILEAVQPLKLVYFALGRSLRLKTADLKLIQQAYPDESDAEQALSDTLEFWLQKKYNAERFGPPTWRMLVEAVDRKAGGNSHELAKEIASNHPATVDDTDGATQPSQPSKRETKIEDVLLTPENTREIIDLAWDHRARWKLIGTELGIDTGTLDAIDANNKKVEGCLNDLISGWLRNSKARPTRAAVIAVLKSEYILSAAVHESKSATTDDSIFREYTEYLMSLYKAKTQACYQDKDHWPPPVTNKVFRLAMIKAEKVEKRKFDDDFIQSTITGKVDDILRKKVPVELENIFSGVEKGHQIKVLIEGGPGCGKSTLSQHICHQWGEGKLFQEYSHVILVRLREPTVQNVKTLSDMLPRRDDSMGEEVAKALCACDGQGILLIFDGWDELSQSAAGRLIITDILNSSKLHKCSLIVTSRPIASMSLLNFVNSRIEILGFTKDELQQYFAGCLDNDNSKVLILQQKIQENPAVAGSCYLPLNASILVHLFKCENELPKTQFDIFSALICNCIYRHLKKTTKERVPVIESLEELPQTIEAPFKQICMTAYEGVMEETIVFKLDDGFNTLGLLQGVESFAKYGMLSCSYNFLHLSIQELLAAVHMATQLDDEQQVEQFTKLFGRPRFSAVFRFYAAKTKLKTPGIKEIVANAAKLCTQHRNIVEFTPDIHQKSTGVNFGHESQPLLVNLLHCLYEARDKKLCQLVVTDLNQKLDLRWINLDPADCLSVGYVLNYGKDFEVNLEHCNIGDDGCKTLFKQDGDYSGLRSLNLAKNLISSEGAVSISIPMKTMTNLRELRLHENLLSDQAVKASCKALKAMSNLRLLNLGGNSIGHEGAITLSEALKSMTTIQGLHLWGNCIGDEGATAISKAMTTMTNLQLLRLDDNSIGDDGAKAISAAVKTMTNLQCLYIHKNFIGETGQAALSAAGKQSDTSLYGLDEQKSKPGTNEEEQVNTESDSSSIVDTNSN